ncbi:MAG TPA: hypothetical protein VET48_04865 [Steroidobacteraceae bacterium]|nr:hypothetical protein [Steroidobacteraceae bacterium]
MITGRKPVSGSQIQGHRTTVPNTADAIWYPIYDSVTYAAAGQTNLTFFSLPIGQGTTTAPGATGAKTEADTNLTNAGLFPKGNRFYMMGIEFKFVPGNTVGKRGDGAVAATAPGRNWTDVNSVAQSGWVKVVIQNRTYVQDGPLGVFPSQDRLAGAAALADTTTAAAAGLVQVDYASFAGAPYQIVPAYIDSNQFFGVTVTWPAAVALPSGVAGRLWCRLLGQLVRDAQ